MYTCLHIRLGTACMWCPQRPEGYWSSGTGVMDGCGPWIVGASNQSWVLCKTQCFQPVNDLSSPYVLLREWMTMSHKTQLFSCPNDALHHDQVYHQETYNALLLRHGKSVCFSHSWFPREIWITDSHWASTAHWKEMLNHLDFSPGPVTPHLCLSVLVWEREVKLISLSVCRWAWEKTHLKMCFE